MDKQAKENLIQSLRDVVKIRWFLLLGLIGLEALDITANQNLDFEWSPLYTYLRGYAFLNIVYYYFLNIRKNISETTLRIIKALQIIIGPLLFTAMVYYSGGLANHLHILYFISIIITSILYEPMIVIAELFYCSMLFTGIILAEYFHYLPHMDVYLKSDIHVIGNDFDVVLLGIANIIFILWIVGGLSLYLVRALRKREDQLMEEKDKTRSTIEALPDGLIMFDKNFKITLLNREMEKLFKIKKEDFENKNLASIHPRTAIQGILDLARQKIKGEKKVFLKEINLKDQENPLTIQTSVVPVLDKHGNRFGTMQIFHDISREKAVDTVKSEFISIAAHQLRTPLSGLKWLLYMIINDDMGEVSQKIKDNLKKGYETNERMIGLVNDLLNISRIEEGRFGYNFKKENFKNIMDEIVSEVMENSLIKEKQIAIVIEGPKNKLPTIRIDRGRIGMAFHNLIDNAIKYSPSKSKISIKIERKERNVLISIQDRGIGIPKSEQIRAFSKFFRGSNVLKMETSGSGLGLFITRNIILAHGGNIWFNSKEAEGTTFFITLPFAEYFVIKEPNPEFKSFLEDI